MDVAEGQTERVGGGRSSSFSAGNELPGEDGAMRVQGDGCAVGLPSSSYTSLQTVQQFWVVRLPVRRMRACK